MNLFKGLKLGVLSGAATMQKNIGDIITARITVETPAPLHGIGFNLHWSGVLEYVAGSISWGDLFSGSDDVANPVDVGLYIERAQMPDKTATPAGNYTVCTLQFKAIAAGAAEIAISNLLATRYREDVSIEEYETESVPASLEVVMSEPSGKVIVRVEIS